MSEEKNPHTEPKQKSLQECVKGLLVRVRRLEQREGIPTTPTLSADPDDPPPPAEPDPL